MSIEGLLAQMRTTRDAPVWLVLADWYEEQGDLDRASLIRLQLQRDGLDPLSAEALQIRLQERALLHANGERWRGELPQWEGVQWGRFERGMVTSVAFDTIHIFSATIAACARATPLRRVVIRWPTLSKGGDPLDAVEGLDRVTIVGRLMSADSLEWLANSALLSTVTELDIVDSNMPADAIGRLLQSPFLKQLRALRIVGHDLGNDGVEQLVQAEMPELRELDLSIASEQDLGSGGRYESTMDEIAARALAGWGSLVGLERLLLTGNQIGVEGLAALLASPAMASVKHLGIKSIADWGYDGGRDDVLPAFAQAHPDLSLDVLDISESDLVADTADAFVHSPALAGLRQLGFDYATSPGCFANVADAPWSESLAILSAHDCAGGMVDILGRAFPRLHSLELRSQYYWSRQESLLDILSKAPPQPALLHLDLTDSGIRDEALKYIDRVRFPELRSLVLTGEYDVNFSPAAASAFADTALGKQLVSFDCYYEHLARAPEPAPVAVGRGEYRGPVRLL